MENKQQLLEDYVMLGALIQLLDAKDIKEVMSDEDALATVVVGVKLAKEFNNGEDRELGKKLLEKYVTKVVEGGAL